MTPLRPLSLVVSMIALLTVPALAHDGPHDPSSKEPAVASASAEPSTHGAPITVKKALPIQKLEKKPARFEGKTIRLEGVVAKVCQGRGCWIEVEGPGGVTFLAKSLDESVLVPMDCQGRKVVVQGVVTRLAAKGHDHAKDHDHAHDVEVGGHVCPSPNWVLAMHGVELRARP